MRQHFGFTFTKWNSPWTISEYSNEFARLADEHPSFTSVKDDYMWADYAIVQPPAGEDTTIKDEISKYSGEFQLIHENAVLNLESKIRESAVVFRFDFPNEVKVPCEQYLLYFVQFLRDLGVEANAELRHEAGKALFAVTPTNRDEALDKIREALMIYLGMSASPINNLATLDYEIAIQRFAGEIQSLQSRVTLARAELQLKEATIQQQQVTIESLRRMDAGFMLESIKDVTPKPKEDDREELIEGLVAVKKFEWNFVEIGIPEAFRRLKQMFGEKKGGKK